MDHDCRYFCDNSRRYNDRRERQMTIVIAILAETIVASFASFFLKKAAAVDNKAKILLSPFFYLGGIMYVGSACVNIYLLKSKLYPIGKSSSFKTLTLFNLFIFTLHLLAKSINLS